MDGKYTKRIEILKKNLVDFRNLISITGSLLVKGTADF